MFLDPIRELPRATVGFPATRAQLALRPRAVPVPLGFRVEAAPLDEFALRTFRAVLVEPKTKGVLLVADVPSGLSHLMVRAPNAAPWAP